MATHSNILAWRIPGTEEPSGLPSMGSHRVGHDWSNLAAAAVATCEIDRQSRLYAWDRVLRAGTWDDPEGWDVEGGGRGVQDGGQMYTHGWIMWMYGKNHYNIVK